VEGGIILSGLSLFSYSTPFSLSVLLGKIKNYFYELVLASYGSVFSSFPERKGALGGLREGGDGRD